MIGPRTVPISDGNWEGLAGALSFENGDRPWYVYLPNQNVHVCAGLESVEAHFYEQTEANDTVQDKCGAFYPQNGKFTSLMGRAIAETVAETVVSAGFEDAMAMLGMERVI